jgi:hypothetical protein
MSGLTRDVAEERRLFQGEADLRSIARIAVGAADSSPQRVERRKQAGGVAPLV